MNDLTIKQNTHNEEVARLKEVYKLFIEWMVTPIIEKDNIGIRTQKDFSREYSVSEQTLIKWKGKVDFQATVRDLRQKLSFERTQGVIDAVYKSALKGNDKSQKLWFQLFEGFIEKPEQPKEEKVEFTINDIRYIIDGLPEPLRSEHYGNLTKLLEDATMVQNARTVEADNIQDWTEGEIYRQTDTTTQNISVNRTDELAVGYTKCLCADLVWQASENNYQSTERWW